MSAFFAKIASLTQIALNKNPQEYLGDFYEPLIGIEPMTY